MKINLIKRPDGNLEPSLDDDRKKLGKIQPGECVLVEMKKVRDSLNHRRYFAMIRIAFENQEVYSDEEIFRKSLEMEAGYFEEVELHWQGETIRRRWPKSIAYEKLPEDEFTELRSRVGDVICKRLDISESELQEEILLLANVH